MPSTADLSARPGLAPREHRNTRLLAMSFDSAASPSISIRALAERSEEQEKPYGWGFAWYPAEAPAALVIKDPTSIGENAMTKLLSGWERFQSTVFVCHLRGAARTIGEQDTHPFARAYAGRDWILAHNGDLAGDLYESIPLGDDPSFVPLGRTDSERAFCWILTKAREAGAKRLADIGWETLHGWFRELDALGTANFILTDGVDLVVYRDDEGYNTLHWARLLPPHDETRLVTEDIEVDLGDAQDRTRTAVLFSTLPLTSDGWAPMQGGQMVVVRRGQFVFDSHAEAAARRSMVVPVPAEVRSAFVEPLEGPHAVETAAQIPGLAVATPIEHPSPMPSPLVDSLKHPSSFPRTGFLHRQLGPGRVLSVRHDTRYRYTTAVEKSHHLFRLQPVHDIAQEVLSHELTISTGGWRREYDDVFGNMTVRAEVEQPYSEMRILTHSVVRVRTQPSGDLQSPIRRMSIPLQWMPWQRQMMLPYLLPPELPETQLVELDEYAMSFVQRQDNDLVQTLIDMNMTIYRDYRYVSGSTTLATTPYEVFCNRKGVCQDFANLFICLARLLNIPARYRVGYIFTGGNYENKVQSDASHAWVELYLPWMGWQGFDPTNGCLVGRDHVRVACGRNYRDATPTSGTIYKGGGGETLSVEVKVQELDE